MKTLVKKQTTNERPIDCLGRVHLPKQIREKLNLKENDLVEVNVSEPQLDIILPAIVITKVGEEK